jgi:hypothetical protein
MGDENGANRGETTSGSNSRLICESSILTGFFSRRGSIAAIVRKVVQDNDIPSGRTSSKAELTFN